MTLTHKPFFSGRLPTNLKSSALQQALDSDPAHIDLMESNPTRCGFHYPPLDVPLVGPQALSYAPAPFGSWTAREHLAAYLAQVGHVVPPEHLMLTASTSEAYSYLFKLLCAPGEAVAVSAPTYPLVPHLAELESVRSIAYALTYTGMGGWRIDLDSVAHALAQGVKALVLIAPNSPTGACLAAAEAQQLAQMCARAQVAIIVDEVFAPYAHAMQPSFNLLAAAPLVFVLRGLSKEVGLPQLKLGWIAVHGAATRLVATLPRLAWIGDTYLSVSAPVQQALPELLAMAPALQAQIRARLATNRATLQALMAGFPALTLLPAEGGWYAVVQTPQSLAEEEMMLLLARQARVALHPGYFYDFARRGYLVSGLLLPAPSFQVGWERTLQTLQPHFGL